MPDASTNTDLPEVPEGRALINAMLDRRANGQAGLPKFKMPEGVADDGDGQSDEPGAEEGDRSVESLDNAPYGKQDADEEPGEAEQESRGEDSQNETAGEGDDTPDDDTQTAKTPTGVEKRLARQRRRLTARHQQEMQGLRGEMDALKQQVQSLTQQPAGQPAPAQAQAQQASAPVEADPIPIADDYRTSSDYENAMDRWLEGDEVGTAGLTDAALAMRGQQSQPQQQAPEAQAEQPPAQQEQQQEAPTAVQMLWDDAFVNISDLSGSDSTLSEEFRQAISPRDANGRFRPTGEVVIVPSEEVLEYLADNDDAHLIVQKWIEKPLLSHRLLRKSPEEQIKHIRRSVRTERAKAKKGDGLEQVPTKQANPDMDLGDTHATPKGKPPNVENMTGRQTIEHMIRQRASQKRRSSLIRVA